MKTYSDYIKDFDKMYAELLKQEKHKAGNIPACDKRGVVYIFSKGKRVLYVGRTKQEIGKRINGHIHERYNDSPLALRILLSRLNGKYTYKPYSKTHPKSALLDKPGVRSMFNEIKKEIKTYDVRYLQVRKKQTTFYATMEALFEIYVHIRAKTPYNSFDTH